GQRPSARSASAREARMRIRLMRLTMCLFLVFASSFRNLAAEPAEAAGAGRLTTVAGTGQEGYSGDDGPATRAKLNQPFHCECVGTDVLYIAEANNHCIRKLDLRTGILTTVAGCGRKGYSGDDASALKATLNEPYA